MRLILGLGNPGSRYEGTRHNVGFDAVDELARRWQVTLDRERHRARYGKGLVAGASVILAKPLTFMNVSGEAAKPLLGYHGLEAEDLVVLHDEADLEPGTVRVKVGGGIAGHNGLRSITQHLGTRDYVRVRIGIGRPDGGGEHMARHVLVKPSPDDAASLAIAIDRTADAVEMILREGAESAMQEFNRRSEVS